MLVHYYCIYLYFMLKCYFHIFFLSCQHSSYNLKEEKKQPQLGSELSSTFTKCNAVYIYMYTVYITILYFYKYTYDDDSTTMSIICVYRIYWTYGILGVLCKNLVTTKLVFQYCICQQ